MNILFMTSSEFSIPCLDKIINSEHQLVGIVTRPDKPEGRGRKIKTCIIKEYASRNSIKCFDPVDLKNVDFIEDVRNLKPDLAIVAAFRILPEELFTIPKFGTINIHASLLPEYRGAAPINWAIISGETGTGLSIFFINERIDQGKIILQKKMEIGKDETAGELHQRMTEQSSELLMEVFGLIQKKKVTAIPQEKGVYKKAPKIKPEHLVIDWSKSAVEIHNLIRGLSPYPGAYTTYNNKRLKILKNRVFNPDKNDGIPGSVCISNLNDGIVINTGKGMIQILELLKEGKGKMSVKDFLIGNKIKEGDIFK